MKVIYRLSLLILVMSILTACEKEPIKYLAAEDVVKTVNSLRPDESGNVKVTDDSFDTRNSENHSKSNKQFSSTVASLNGAIHNKANATDLGKKIGNKTVKIEGAKDNQVLTVVGEDIVPTSPEGTGIKEINDCKEPKITLLNTDSDFNSTFKVFSFWNKPGTGNIYLRVPVITHMMSEPKYGVISHEDYLQLYNKQDAIATDGKENQLAVFGDKGFQKFIDVPQSADVVPLKKAVNRLNDGSLNPVLDLDKIEHKANVVHNHDIKDVLELDVRLARDELGISSNKQTGVDNANNITILRTDVDSARVDIDKSIKNIADNRSNIGKHIWNHNLFDPGEFKENKILVGVYDPATPPYRWWEAQPLSDFDGIKSLVGDVGNPLKDPNIKFKVETNSGLEDPRVYTDHSKQTLLFQFPIAQFKGTGLVSHDWLVSEYNKKADKDILQKDIIASDSIEPEKVGEKQIKLNLKGNVSKGLTKVVEKDLENIKKGNSVVFPIPDVYNFRMSNALIKDKQKSELKVFDKFNDPENFYESNEVIVDTMMHLSNVSYKPLTYIRDTSKIVGTGMINYKNTEKSIVYVRGQLIPYWYSTDEDRKVTKDSFSKPFQDMVKAFPDMAEPYLYVKGSDPGFMQKRSWHNYMVDPALFVGDFEYTFYDVIVDPKDKPITKTEDDAHSFYFEAGICDMDKDMLIYPGNPGNNDVRHLEQTLYMHAMGDEVYWNTGHMRDARFSTKKKKSETQYNVTIHVKRIGENIYYTVVGTDGFYKSDTDPNVKYKYILPPVLYSKPVRVYLGLMSLCLASFKNRMYYYPHTTYIGTKPTGFVIGDDLYTFSPNRVFSKIAENFSQLTGPEKEKAMEKATFGVYDLTDAKTDFPDGMVEVITYKTTIPRDVYVSSLPVGKGAIFRKTPYDLGNAVGIDQIKISGKAMTDLLKESNLEPDSVKVIVSIDGGVRWYGYNYEHATWEQVSIRSVVKPGQEDQAKMDEWGLPLDKMGPKDVDWDRFPQEEKLYTKVQLGFLIKNKNAQHLTYLNELQLDVVDYRHWDLIDESPETYNCIIDYNRSQVEFFFNKDYEEIRLMMYFINPSIISKD